MQNNAGHPSWMRGVGNRSNTSNSNDKEASTTSSYEESQQLPSSLRQQLSSPPSGFASSFSAFFPSSASTGGGGAVTSGDGENNGNASGSSNRISMSADTRSSNSNTAQLGDYPLFSSRRAGGSNRSTSIMSSSPPFGTSNMTAATDHGPNTNINVAASSSFGAPLQSSTSSSSSSSIHGAMLPPAPGYAMTAYANSNNIARYRRPSVLATSSIVPDENDGHDLDDDDDEDGNSNNNNHNNNLSIRGDNDLYDSPIGSRLGSVSGADPDDMQSVVDDDDVDMDMSDFSSAIPSAYVEGGTLNNRAAYYSANQPLSSSSLIAGSNNNNTGSAYGNTSASRTAAVAIPNNRARSHSQSSSIMATSAQLARSPSAWPSSPPRSAFTPSANPQHMLARLTSEQQQAMAASASSASSAFYMIPTPYRQAMGGSAASGGDLLLGGTTEEDNEELSPEEEDDDIVRQGKGAQQLSLANSTSSSEKSANRTSETTTNRGFNPLNPYSERPSALQRDSSRESEMNMDQSGGPGDDRQSTQSLQHTQQHQQQQQPSSLEESSTSTSSSGQSSSAAAILRASKSSPSLAGMNALSSKLTAQASPTTSTYSPASRDFRTLQSREQIPFPPSNPGSPNTLDAMSSPFKQNSSLRRSQSASHRPTGLLPFSQYTKDPLRSEALQQNNDGGILPLTAPPIAANAFRFQRANSLSDISRLQRHGQFGRHALAHGSSGIIQPHAQSEEMSQDLETRQEQRNSRQPSHSSGSESPNGNPKVVRRAVSHKKGSLMPKSKDHLRTMAQLRLETGEFEVASEAALHRLSTSSAAAPAPVSTPNRRNTTTGLTAFPSPFASLPRASTLNYGSDGTAGPSGTSGRPTSSHGPKPLFQPTRNRFPETVVDDEDDAGVDSSGSENDYASLAEAGMDQASASDTGGGMLIGEDEDASSNAGENSNGESMAFNRSAWLLRDPAISKPLTPGGPARVNAEMDLSPSSALGWSSLGARPGKRKLNDSERFESYNAAFKRRAVSPASASSVSLSPLLAVRDLQGAGIPPAPPNLSTLGPAAQISSSAYSNHIAANSVPPSPIVGTAVGSAWSSASRSRGTSPVPSAVSASGKRWPEEEKERKSVDIGKMSLG